MDVAEDAEAQFRVFVQHLAIGHIVAEMGRDEHVVRQHLADQRANLFAALDPGIGGEDAAAFGRKPFEAVSHIITFIWPVCRAPAPTKHDLAEQASDKRGGIELDSGVAPPLSSSPRKTAMADDHLEHPIVHLVGSIPLPDAETVFRTLAAAAGPHLLRLPDGETGIRKTWIRFLQAVLAENPAIELAADVPPFKFTQWDGKLLREIPRLRIKPGATPDPATFETGYAEMAIRSWSLFA